MNVLSRTGYVIALLLASVVTAGAQAATETISGMLPDGTPWLAEKPDNWNGVLTLDLDFAGFPLPPGVTLPPRPNPLKDWMLANGYAMGGIRREPVGYDLKRAVDYLLTVREHFVAKWGVPRHTVATGNSRGAFVARKAMEYYPHLFAGALVSSGGAAGSIAVLNSKLDTVWALKTLVSPQSPLRLVNIADVKQAENALAEILAQAAANPQGRARLALALAFEQFPAWSSRSKSKPAVDDYDAQLDQAIENFLFANPAVVRAGVEKVAGGNVSWNHGIDYTTLLRRSGQSNKVAALYRRAGLDLRKDLRVLAAAPRITADFAAVARAEKLTSYTGRISGPVVNVDNDDPVDPAPLKLAYPATLRRAGKADLHRLLWADGAGHGGQTDLDRAVGLTLLMQRINTGSWGDTRLPALRKLAAGIAAASGNTLGADTFFDLEPPAPLRTWDVTNWDSSR